MANRTIAIVFSEISSKFSEIFLQIFFNLTYFPDMSDYLSVLVYQENSSAGIRQAVKGPYALGAVKVIKLNPRIAVAFNGVLHVIEGFIFTGNAA